MKKIPKATYETAEQVDARVKLRGAEAATLPDDPERQLALIKVAKLRVYADANAGSVGNMQISSSRLRQGSCRHC